MPQEDLKPVMDRAKELAGLSALGYVGLAHVALATLEQLTPSIRRVLEEDCAVDVDGLVLRLMSTMPRGGEAEEGLGLAFSPELKDLFEQMIDLKRRSGADRFGLEHLTAAVFGSTEGAWRVFLAESGLDGEVIARLVLERGSEFIELEMQQIDVFATQVFRGNPAAVVPLASWLPKALMQAVAAENNLSETAFTVPMENDFHIRWFTPTEEVGFCGHATIAAARMLLDAGAGEAEQIRFHSAAGPLSVTREGDLLVLDGPELKPLPTDIPVGIEDALGLTVKEALEGGGDLVLVVADEDAVRDCRPDMRALARFEHRGIVITAPGREVDFVSRFFGPRVGVPEDPATGSAHCVLAPFWGERLGRREMSAAQLSARGGEIHCRLREGRVEVAGRTRRYLDGRIRLPRSL